MSEVVRVKTTVDEDPNAWAAPRDPQPPSHPYNAERGEEALITLGRALDTLKDAVEVIDDVADIAAQHLAANYDVQQMVETVAFLDQAVNHLRTTSAMVTRETGLATAELSTERQGTLSDGRGYEVLYSPNRKAWDHDRWKAAVRQAIIDTRGLPPELANPTDGELVNVHDLLTAVQDVHASAGPKVGALKALHVDPDDYCEVVPGHWAVKFTRKEAGEPVDTTG